jgi:dihydrofolate reductase
MKKIVLFLHVSLDGFVAGPNGEMNWIKVDADIFDYVGKRIQGTDTALYGRKTFDMMEAYWPTAADKPNASKHDKEHSAWYSTVHKVVVSKTLQGKQLPRTTIISDNVASAIRELKQGDGREIIIFGSPSVGHLLVAEGLVDGLWLFVNPILLGEGIPVFAGIKERAPLKLETSHIFDSGVICLHYEKA